MSEAYDQYKARIAELQDGKSRDEITKTLQQKSEHVFDPATAAPIKHRWIDRGIKMSCEDAGHPYHQSYKRGAGMPMS